MVRCHLGSFTCWNRVFGKKWIVGRTVSEQYGLGGDERNAYLSLEVSESWSSKAEASACFDVGVYAMAERECYCLYCCY